MNITLRTKYICGVTGKNKIISICQGDNSGYLTLKVTCINYTVALNYKNIFRSIPLGKHILKGRLELFLKKCQLISELFL